MVSTTSAEFIAGTEPEFAQIQARMACLDLVTSFFELVDAGHAARTADLFTSDGTLNIVGKSIEGIEA
ncbi:MAG: hypothetical protein EOO27_51410, partial [Comamonadaceae bacterium]